MWSRHDRPCSSSALPGSFMEITSHIDRRLLTFLMRGDYTIRLAAGEAQCVYIHQQSNEVSQMYSSMSTEFTSCFSHSADTAVFYDCTLVITDT